MFHEVFLANTSHVDITWWDTPKRCAERIVEVIDGAIRMAAVDPEFRFSVENVYSVKTFLDAKPERLDDLRRLLEEGRMDVGGLYVAPVSDYSFDEALYRNFTFGKQWLLEHIGHDTPLAREEDSPGHTLQTPQLCRGFGMRYLRFSRGPRGLFRWAGPDGSEVLVQTADYSFGYYPRLGANFTEKWKRGLPLRLRQTRESGYEYDTFLLLDGDDNALPNEEATRLVRTWNAHNKSPKFRMATITDFFRNIENATIPVHRGDIPNTWAVLAAFQPDAMETVRELRNTLPIAEMRLALSSATGITLPPSSLEQIWRTLLECLDHNWGGRFQGAYGLEGDLHKLSRLRAARDKLNTIMNDTLAELSARLPSRDGAPSLPLFNPFSCIRTGPATFILNTSEFPAFANGPVRVTDSSGNTFPAQEITEGADTVRKFVFLADGIPPYGYKTFYIKNPPDQITDPSLTRISRSKEDCHIIENDYYRIQTSPDGAAIQSIHDKELDREILPGAAGGMLGLFGIRLRFNEVWAMGFRLDAAPDGFYDDPRNEGKVGEKGVVTGEIVTAGECGGVCAAGESGPVFAALRSRIPFIHGSTVEQEILLYHGVKRIDLRTTINWTGAENYLLCLALPFGPAGGTMTMDVPFGVHRFGDEAPGFWGKTGGPNPAEKLLSGLLGRSAKKWLRRNFLEGKNPVMAWLKDKLSQLLLREDAAMVRGLYNWLDVSGEDWGATLSTSHAPFDFSFGLNAFLLASVRESAFFNGGHYLRRGTHTFSFTLSSHAGNWSQAGIHQTGRVANAPLSGRVTNGGDGTLPTQASLLACDSPNIVVTALKPGPEPGSIIVRFYESCGKRTAALFRSGFPVRRAARCDMMERETAEINISDSAAASLDIEPFEIVNVKIFFSKPGL